MLRNYFLTAVRTLSRNRIYAVLNILGLSLGIGCALVIFKVVAFENSFDKHQSNYENIYRIVHEDRTPDGAELGGGTPHPLGPALLNDYPALKAVARTNTHWREQVNVLEKDGSLKKILLEEEGIVFTEPQYFDIFDVEFLAGDRNTVLSEPKTAVISTSMARKLFGYKEGVEVEAMGRLFNLGNQYDAKVVGIINAPPEATNFNFHILLDYESLKIVDPWIGDGTRWGSTSSSTNTWFLVDDEFDGKTFDEQLVDFGIKYLGEETAANRKYMVQALSEVHSNDELGNYSYTTPAALVNALGVIAIFLILTACINFINLATAQAANRSREIGIRKALGSYSHQLVGQFLLEISIVTFLSLIISIAIGELLFSQLEDIIGTRLSLDLLSSQTLLFLIGMLVAVSLLSGFYPAILLSNMNTIKALKNKITAKNSSGGLSLRKTLVVGQFAITQFLIIGTIIIGSQMNYFLTKDLGFEKAAIFKSYLPERDEVKNERLRQLLLENPEIADVSLNLSSPTGSSNSHSDFNYAPLNSKDDYTASYKCVDERYMELYGLELLAGRNIKDADSANYVVINQRMADLMGFQDDYEGAIGERLSSGWNGMKLKVIGVMKDFHSQELSEGMQYVLLLNFPGAFYEIAVKNREGADIRDAVKKFEASWEEVYPEYVADWSFFEDDLAEMYDREQSMSSLMSIFSVISILIGCLGLYGLIAFIAANRTKEVGIRKVLGASVLNIILGFSREVFFLILVAFVLAGPAAYLVLNNWLSDYEFRIAIGVDFFVIAFLATLVIAGLTISHRTISTALINPATTLKDE